ncbi:DUF4231 domain-containing protein [Paracoccus laeviglucosivorans]|uniref:DUF4231 domain-containing protein n=1 Tax=Paracoccus laeviglucosivorans TaxID=1197861 RepID=A0A521DZK6_9RHOB|nr:DUF4231 domain-containing protein [Paracoccus laeviglucosivorans]SMO77068.1 Protein of unknown function [Paracoccus laeviglucosivorans]
MKMLLGVATHPLETDSLATLLRNAQYYETHARIASVLHHGSSLLIVVFSSAIPLIPLIGADTAALTFRMAVLGAAITIVQGARQLFGFHDRWIYYRTAREALRCEAILYHAEAGPYRTGDKNKVLAEALNTILSTENLAWRASMLKNSALPSGSTTTEGRKN